MPNKKNSQSEFLCPISQKADSGQKLIVSDSGKKAKDLTNKLENHTGLDVVDSQIVAISISNNLTFWSGDYYILREKIINEIKEVLRKYPGYTFRYKKE